MVGRGSIFNQRLTRKNLDVLNKPKED